MELVNKRLDFFDSFLDNYRLDKGDLNLNIWCPFCRHPSKNKLKMSIHLEKCFYHCWICDKKGGNIPYLVSVLNKSKYGESQKLFRSKSKSFSLFEEEESFQEDLVTNLPEGFKFFIEDFDFKDPDSKDVFKYAIKRGVNKHKMCMMRMGYSSHYEFKRYLIIPSYNRNGHLNYYVSRKIKRGGRSF